MSLLEVCVDDVAGLNAAIQGGADRIELCSSLAIGGLTPSAGLMAEASHHSVPVVALIRPRSGGFLYSAAEERVMLRDIELAAELGLAGVAIGALTREGSLDLAMLGRLARRAEGLQLTLHRAFDLVRDQTTALEEAISLGFHRILSSGGAPSAPAGAAQLASLVEQSRSRIQILAGSGINSENVAELLFSTGVQEVHASCRTLELEPAPELLAFGFAGPSCRATSAMVVRALKLCILEHGQNGNRPPFHLPTHRVSRREGE
ncbi:copper homeostasis protein CutC [Roseateles oligotrophus]|uniref:PF03932 family protein CutC n=1 Tax=Roseateles oligotrophus TaxID=1769250 RepID=A0ABT2YK83_9BURK|nr:copper homeostasis protein CutC [Roseateles oligotrophus]MCV2370475.1 copper homeostasis protein CutC [Roseateles oligotrophus]